MANKLQWYDDMSANWIDLEPDKHATLDPSQKYLQTGPYYEDEYDEYDDFGR